MHVSNWFYNEPNIRLADALCRRTGFDRAFFCNSGTEANEALLKLARHHFYGLGQKERLRVVAFENAFHGRTLGVAVDDPQVPRGLRSARARPRTSRSATPTPSSARWGRTCARSSSSRCRAKAACSPRRPGFLAKLRPIADAHGALLLADEIQTGVGRLGRFLATEGTGAKPDAVSLAKGLAGGFPIGAMLTTEKLAGALPPGSHGSTFGGNALASAAALAVLRILDEERLIDGARTKGEALGAMLRQLAADLPDVFESARGEGLLWGLVMRPGFVAREILPRINDAGRLADRRRRERPALLAGARRVDCRARRGRPRRAAGALGAPRRSCSAPRPERVFSPPPAFLDSMRTVGGN